MSGVATAVVAGTVVGGYLQGQSAKSAAQTSADAQRYAADQAAEAARFVPYGVTTGFGSSKFGFDEKTGSPTASYTLTPEMQAIRDRMVAQAGAYDPTQLGLAAQPLYGGANQAFANANRVSGYADTAFSGGQNLFNVGSGYLEQSPEQARQNYMRDQQALFAGTDEQALANVRNQQYQTGRAGLGVGGTTTGMMQTNPELAALYNARAQRDLNLAAQAENAAQQRQLFGANLQNQGLGMYGTGAGLLSSGGNFYSQGAGLLGQIPAITTAGYSPLQTQLGIAGQIEGYGQSALDIGAQLGGRSATAGANMGQSLLTGGINAARTAQAGNAYNPVASVLQGVGNSPALNSWFQNSLNRSNTGLSYNPGAGYGTATGYDSWNMSNPELVQTQQTYGI